MIRYFLAGAICALFSLYTNAQDKQSSVKTIIVDAGHGGSDVGARGTQTNEATMTLAVAQKLARQLREQFPSIKILETRPTTALPGNQTNATAANRYRAEFANKNDGDLFISLHCNASGKKPGGWYAKKVMGREARTRYVKKGKKRIKQTYYVNQYENVWVENNARGTETYIWAVNKNDQKVSSMHNTNPDDEDYYSEEGGEPGDEGLKLPDPNDPAERARMLIYAQHYFRKSYTLATLVEKEFIASGRNSRGVQQRNHKGIWVLQATGMPSILVEMGFISNNEDQAYLMSEEGQNTIVQDIVNAVKVYLEKYS
ncbi:MAG: N-acetylmuramoyl-L-alanine amidase [Niabella sp.]